MLNRPSEDCYNSRCSLCSCFFSALDDNFKKKVVFISSYLPILCFQRVVFDRTCRVHRLRNDLSSESFFENHDKSGHKNQNNCPVCPHASGKLQFKLKLRRLLVNEPTIP